MKILLHAYYYDQDHQMGGAFTFQDEILKALKKNLHQTHHQFVGLEVDSQKYIEHPQIKNIMYRCSFWSRVKRSILWRLGKRQALFPNREVHEKLVAEGVEMIWGIVPAGLPTEDLPYILTVWDCQGRKQPYFPDMGDAKNWRQADGHYVGTFMRSAALMIGVPQGKKELNELYGIPLERIKVLPFPVPEYAKNFKAPDLATVLNSLDLPVDPFLFYPAQFAAHKNHVGLLKALVHLPYAVVLVSPNLQISVIMQLPKLPE
jgi:uncharacterized short protein YbdD (DUF466 family)